MNFDLTQVNGNVINIGNNPLVQSHANDGKNFFEIIINQINQCLYKEYMPDVNKPATIIDIGTNIGLFSLHVAIPGWKVHSFEPTHRFCEIFDSVLKQHKITNVLLNECAVYNYDGETDFGMCDFNTTMNSIGGTYSKESVKVQCIQLATYIKAANIKSIDFVKLDAEGAEPAILDSIPDEVYKIIKTFFIEFHERPKDVHRQGYKFLMEQKGYVTTLIGDDTLVCVRPKSVETETKVVAESVENCEPSSIREIFQEALEAASHFQNELTGTELKTLSFFDGRKLAFEKITDRYINKLIPEVLPIKSITLTYEDGSENTQFFWNKK